MKVLTVSQKRSEDLKLLCEIDPGALADIAAQLERASPRLVDIEALTGTFASYLPSEDTAAILAATTVSMKRLAHRNDVSAEIVLSWLESGLNEASWVEEELSEWGKRKHFLARIIDSGVLEVATKSSELYYSHHNHIQSVKILTELRPVFTKDRDDIVGFIAVNNLYMTYSSGEDESDIEIAVGLDELHRMKREIDSAIQKTKTVKRLIEADDKVVRVYTDE